MADPQHDVAVVDDGQLRVAPLVELPPALRELGWDPELLFGEAAFDAALLRNPENTVPISTLGRLLKHCAERTGCPHLGLLVARRCDISVLGVVGLLMQHAPDVDTALRCGIEHLHLHDRGAVPTSRRSGSTVAIGYNIYAPGVPGADQIYAYAIAITQRVMQGLCGADWRAAEVLLPFRRPRDVVPYRQFFGATLRFDAGCCELIFPAKWLQHRIGGADPALRRAAESMVATLEGRSNGGIVPSVRRTLRAMLAAGRAAEDGVARAFALHRRTLLRRLNEEGTTFQRLLDESRFEVACQLLRDSDAPIDQIANGLGYSGASAFGRAFKRWSGLAPQSWREDAAGRSVVQTRKRPGATVPA
jgi:AraC-like DNA-binding protein